jgi:hypothetical protein
MGFTGGMTPSGVLCRAGSQRCPDEGDVVMPNVALGPVRTPVWWRFLV